MPSLAYPCVSAPEDPEGHYTRLCLGVWPPVRSVHLREPAQRMHDSPAKTDGPVVRAIRGRGFAYLGQFIDHDVTRDIRLLNEAIPEVEQISTSGRRGSTLTLLYGKDPSTVPCLYEANGLRPKLGRPRASREGMDKFWRSHPTTLGAKRMEPPSTSIQGRIVPQPGSITQANQSAPLEQFEGERRSRSCARDVREGMTPARETLAGDLAFGDKRESFT